MSTRAAVLTAVSVFGLAVVMTGWTGDWRTTGSGRNYGEPAVSPP